MGVSGGCESRYPVYCKIEKINKTSRGGGGEGVRGGRGGGAGRCEPRIEVIVKLKSRGVVG